MELKSYSDLRRLETFIKRFDYLKIAGNVGEITFGFERYINQVLYTSRRWRTARDQAIMRDEGCDLGVPGFEIRDRVIVHHMNPISIEDVMAERPYVYDPEFLICTRHRTHLAIHYGDSSLLSIAPVIRSNHDTTPWKNQNGRR